MYLLGTSLRMLDKLSQSLYHVSGSNFDDKKLTCLRESYCCEPNQQAKRDVVTMGHFEVRS